MELKIKNLNKYYGVKHVLKNFTVSLSDGIYGLLGPNGAGKSTLMNILTDNIGFDSGEITYNGENIFELGKNFRKILGYMPQHQCLYESFTAHRFLSYVGALKGMKRDYAEERIDYLLHRVNLADVKNRKLSSFSGGMKQRVMIVQAFLDDPKVIIMDEPTAGLDPKERIRIRNLISGMSKDKIVIIATHVVSDIEFISKRILMLKGGELLYNQSPAELQTMLEGSVFEIKVSEVQVNEIAGKFTVSNIYRNNDEDIVIRIITDSEPSGYQFNAVQPMLEDVYLSVFKEESAHKGDKK